MAQRYTGLPPALKEAVYTRDKFRCRWCGTTNARAYDVHHIAYRRGYAYDVIDNLITVCRDCHSFVHDSYAIPKPEAQAVLFSLITPEGMGSTGMSVWRQRQAENAAEDSDERPLRAPAAPHGRVGRLINLD